MNVWVAVLLGSRLESVAVGYSATAVISCTGLHLAIRNEIFPQKTVLYFTFRKDLQVDWNHRYDYLFKKKKCSLDKMFFHNDFLSSEGMALAWLFFLQQ